MLLHRKCMQPEKNRKFETLIAIQQLPSTLAKSFEQGAGTIRCWFPIRTRRTKLVEDYTLIRDLTYKLEKRDSLGSPSRSIEFLWLPTSLPDKSVAGSSSNKNPSHQPHLAEATDPLASVQSRRLNSLAFFFVVVWRVEAERRLSHETPKSTLLSYGIVLACSLLQAYTPSACSLRFSRKHKSIFSLGTTLYLLHSGDLVELLFLQLDSPHSMYYKGHTSYVISNNIMSFVHHCPSLVVMYVPALPTFCYPFKPSSASKRNTH